MASCAILCVTSRPLDYIHSNLVILVLHIVVLLTDPPQEPLESLQL
jgi:hypothetical protein